MPMRMRLTLGFESIVEELCGLAFRGGQATRNNRDRDPNNPNRR